jgi:hypothetical protein
MSSEIQILLTAVDEATETINQVAANLQAANSQITNSTTAVSAATEEANVSVKNNASAFNNLATSGMSLYMAIDRVENSQVALDRAHLVVEKSTNSVTSAQNHYNEAVAKYGPNSKEAQDGLAKLQTAQDGLQVAQERADMAQRNYNNTIAFSAMTVIPSLITAFSSIITIGPGVTGALDAISGAMDFLAANPIVLVIAGIAALIAGLIWAYNNCAPFRDAINTVAAVLSGAFSAAVTAVGIVVTWLWNDCFKPLADGLTWLWDNILKPLADFIQNVFKGALDAVGTVVKDISGFFGGLSSALGSLCFVHATPAAQEFNKTLSDSIKLTDALGGKLGDLRGGLASVAGVPGSSPVGGIAAVAAGAKSPVTIHVMAPLVNIEGSADKATADLAAQQVMKTLQSIIVEPTSTGAAATQKRIRKGSILQ